MCELVTILTIASTAVSAAGTMMQASAQAKAAEHAAKVADINRRIEERREVDAIERGKEEELKKRQEIAQFQGAQQASYAAAGIDLSYGTPLQNLVNTATQGELDAMQIRRNAYAEANDRRVAGANFQWEADAQRAAASNARTAGIIGAAGTVIGGAAQAAGAWKTYGGGVKTGSGSTLSTTPNTAPVASSSIPRPRARPMNPYPHSMTYRRTAFGH